MTTTAPSIPTQRTFAVESTTQETNLSRPHPKLTDLELITAVTTPLLRYHLGCDDADPELLGFLIKAEEATTALIAGRHGMDGLVRDKGSHLISVQARILGFKTDVDDTPSEITGNLLFARGRRYGFKAVKRVQGDAHRWLITFYEGR